MNAMLASWFGGPQVILILAIIIILFGAKKIPELARGVGLGIKEFKKATREVTEEIQNAPIDSPQPKIVASQSQPPATVSQTTTPPKA